MMERGTPFNLPGETPMRQTEGMHLRQAFTLIELLVVIAIIAVLASILVPAVSKSLVRAREVNKQANLRTMHQANFQYSMDHRGFTCLVSDARDPWNERNWRDLLAPYAAKESERRGEANTERIFIDPFYKAYDPSNASSSGYGMNANPGLPDTTRVNAFWSNGSGKPQQYMFESIELPFNRIHIGDVKDSWFLTRNKFEVAIDTSRHDGKGLFLMFDGSTHKMDRLQARTSFFTPGEYVRN